MQGGRNTTYGSSAILVPNEELGINGLNEGTPYTVTSDEYSLYYGFLFWTCEL